MHGVKPSYKKYLKMLLFILLELPILIIILVVSSTLIEMTIALTEAGADTEQIHYYLNGIVIVCFVFIKFIFFLVERYMIKEEITDET